MLTNGTRNPELKMEAHARLELPSNTDRALFACSLWLHTGYVGAVVAAAGMIQLLADGDRWLPALGTVFSGGVLAAVSWRHARAVLEHANDAPTARAAGDKRLVERPGHRLG